MNGKKNNLKLQILIPQYNDYWLREMIDALTESVDDLYDNHCQCEVYRQHHEKRKLAKEKAREAGEEYREWRCTHRDDEFPYSKEK